MPELPPLLPTGFHTISLADLRMLCVDAFPLSSTRAQLMENLEEVFERLINAGVVGDLWIDGSFLTGKINPGDVDIVLRVDSAFYETAPPAAREACEWVHGNLKAAYNCDSYVFVDWPEKNHAAHALGERLRKTYIKLFGISEEDNVKGIALVRLEGNK